MDVVVLGATRAMATDIRVHAPREHASACDRDRLAAALLVFRTVDRTCTRFDPSSPLMRVNRRPSRWHAVPRALFDAVEAAHRAHQRTRGRFDPRVFGDLVRMGYDRSFAAAGGFGEGGRAKGRQALGSWRPRFRCDRAELHVGGAPIDLGGIGKGLALRWASERLHEAMPSYVLEAGGDCFCLGSGPDGAGWSIGVEDPRAGERPLAVLELRDRACATSSVRVRTWRAGARQVHHLVDPRTGTPGGRGLLAVTVVADDPAVAEVASKTLFLQGRNGVAAAAARGRIAALWVATDGDIGESDDMDRYVRWRSG
jgi:FAD:protein FMN transferase